MQNHPGEPRVARVHVFMSPELLRVVDQVRRRYGASRSGFLRVALEAHLRASSDWPRLDSEVPYGQ